MALADQNIDEEISQDWADIKARNAADDPAPRETTSPESEKITPEGETEGANDETQAEVNARAEAAKARSRKDDGKFAREPKVKPAAALPATKEGTAPAGDTAPAAPVGERQADVNVAPSSYKPAAKAAWAALPLEVRQEIHRREQDFFKGTAQLRPDADLGRGIRDTANQYRAIIDAEGGNPVSAFADYMKTASALRLAGQDGKQQAVLAIVQRFGIDVPSLMQRLGGGQGAPAGGNTPATGQPDPNANAGFRDPRVDSLLTQMQTREQQEQQRIAEQQRSERVSIENTVQSWMDERDAGGQPLRPYIDNVFPEMNILVPQIRQANPAMTHQQVMQIAYDKACWASDDVRPLLQQSLEAKRRADNQQRVTNARRASSVNTPRRASTPNGTTPATMDETITETARQLGMIS